MVRVGLQFLSLVGVQLGHFLHIYAYTLAVEKHKIHRFDGGGHCGHEVTGDGLQDQLSCRLLRKTVPVRERTKAQQLQRPWRPRAHAPQPPPPSRSPSSSLCWLELCRGSRVALSLWLLGHRCEPSASRQGEDEEASWDLQENTLCAPTGGVP